MTAVDAGIRLLLCSDPLSPRMPDSAFDSETAAIEGLDWSFELLDLESLLDGNADRATRRLADTPGTYLYRGWMIPVSKYEDLAGSVANRGSSLLTSPGAYAATHLLPSAYGAIAGHTPKTVWIEGSAPFDMGTVLAAIAPFGHRPLIVKDYVKSRKHEWEEACFIPAADDRATVERVVSRFVELQGDDLAGGLVFREFVELEPVGRHRSGLLLGREYRLFFLDGKLLAGARYWDDVDYEDEYPDEPFERLASEIPSRFFSMDIAKTAMGDWIVMEVGDGQVSGLPDAMRPDDFYARLKQALD